MDQESRAQRDRSRTDRGGDARAQPAGNSVAILAMTGNVEIGDIDAMLFLNGRGSVTGSVGTVSSAFINISGAGSLTLADVNELAQKGGEISSGVISIIFGTGNPQEVALSFVASDKFDKEIEAKEAQHELCSLIGPAFDITLTDALSLAAGERFGFALQQSFQP